MFINIMLREPHLLQLPEFFLIKLLNKLKITADLLPNQQRCVIVKQYKTNITRRIMDELFGR